MRVLFLSSWYPPVTRGGGEISTHLLARALVQRGQAVEVVTAGPRAAVSTYQDVMVRSVPLTFKAKPLLERAAARRQARGLRQLVDLGAYEVIHAHDFRTALALAELVHRGTVPAERAYVTVRDYAPICGTTHNVQRDGRRCRCTVRDLRRTQRYLEAAAPRRYARLWQYWYNVRYRTRSFASLPHHVYISQAQREVVFEQAPFAQLRTCVIWNPVADEYLAAPLVVGVAGTVLYVGTVEDYKGVDMLLESWPEVSRRNAQARLVIAGEGAQRAKYEQYVERSGLQYSVQFAGRVPHERMRRLYESAAAVAVPHRWIEPFGRTAAEAMALGRIVVSADVGGPAEMIADGETGLLFAHGSAPALAERLLEALALPELERRRMSGAARAWAREHLAPAVIARQYEEFYAGCPDTCLL